MKRPGTSTIRRGAAVALWTACASCAAPLAHLTDRTEARPIEAAGAAIPGSGAREPSDKPTRAEGKEPAPAPIEMPAAPEPPAKRRSSRLPSGFHNPMPGGVMAGYRADTGLDIAGSPRPIYAIAAGTLDYSEPGHTLWVGPRDTANTVRMELADPIPWRGRKITHAWYAHLSALETHQPEGWPTRRRIEAGEQLGISGIANHSPHLHLGLLLDNEVSQAWGTFLLEDEVREVLGGYKRGARLPEEPTGAERAAPPLKIAPAAGAPAAALIEWLPAPPASQWAAALLPH